MENLRVTGESLDRVVFSTTNSLNATALDALGNSTVMPEPSAALLGLLSTPHTGTLILTA